MKNVVHKTFEAFIVIVMMNRKIELHRDVQHRESKSTILGQESYYYALGAEAYSVSVQTPSMLSIDVMHFLNKFTAHFSYKC